MKRRRNMMLLWIILAVVLIAAVGILAQQNYRFAKNNRGGNDFLVEWMSTRIFLTKGTSPYSPEITQQIQLFAYGRPAQKGEPDLRMLAPLYSIAVFFPFALISDYPTARAAFMTVLELALVFLAVFSIRLSRWRPRFWMLALFLVFALFWYHSIRPLIDGNVSILVGLMIAAALLALKNGGDELAGVLFAFATIELNVVFLLIIFVLIWSIFSERWRLLGWMFATLFLLSASSALLLPDWIWQNIRGALQNPAGGPPATLGAVLAASFPAMGERIARLIYGVLAGMVIIEWVLNRRAEFPGFLWTALFTLTLGQLIGIPTAPQNFIILLPALTLVFATWEERWRRAGQALSALSMILLFVGIWALFLGPAGSIPTQTQTRLMFLPLPAFLLVTLYWVRWWAIHPPSVWFDYISMKELP